MQAYRYQSQRFSETTSRFEPYRRCTKSDRSHDSSRLQGELRSALRHTLDRLLRPLATATPCTACPLLPKHTLRATMKIPAPPSPPTLNSSRNVSTCKRKHERSREVLFPFEAVIARNAIPTSRLVCDRPFFTTQAGGCAANHRTHTSAGSLPFSPAPSRSAHDGLGV